MAIPWFEFYLPFNVMREPLPLVALELVCWFLVLQLVGTTVGGRVYPHHGRVDLLAVGQMAHAGSVLGPAVAQQLVAEHVPIGGERGPHDVGEQRLPPGGEVIVPGGRGLPQ